MNGDLLAVDPSIVSPGVALFRDGALIAAARIRVPPSSPNAVTNAERALAAADMIAMWCHGAGGQPNTVAFEWPQIYTAAKSKGDPNDLIAMAAVDGALTAVLHLACIMRGVQLRVLCYKPAEWIGQLPKATRGKASTSPRAVRIYSRLSPTELALVPDQHDAIDAVGLGLHSLGRLGVRRVYSNGND